MKKNINKAFTLVELIVVITILAVLATVAFISFQGYTSSSRDTKRLTDIKSIYSALNYYKISKSDTYPIPGNKINITMSWASNILFYQWIMDKKTQESINVFWEAKDPVSNNYYTYTTNTNGTKFSILTKLEWELWSLFQNNTYANDVNIKWFWNGIGAVLDAQWDFVTTNLDISTANDWEYSFAFEKLVIKNLDKSDLISLWISNNKNLSHLDENLWVYYDMETSQNGQLKDFWKYGLHLTATGWIKIWWVDSISGQATYFDWNNDYFYTLDSSAFEPEKFTINTLIKPKLSWEHDYIFQKWCPSSTCNYSGFAMTTRFTSKIRTFFMFKEDPQLENVSIQHVITDFDISDNYQMFTSSYDGNSIKTYVNWEFIEESTASGSTIHYEDDYMMIGKTCPLELCTTGNFEWVIDELKVYETALDENQIKAIYNWYVK